MGGETYQMSHCRMTQAVLGNHPGGASTTQADSEIRGNDDMKQTLFHSVVFISYEAREQAHISGVPLPKKSIWWKRDATIREARDGLRQSCDAPQRP